MASVQRLSDAAAAVRRLLRRLTVRPPNPSDEPHTAETAEYFLRAEREVTELVEQRAVRLYLRPEPDRRSVSCVVHLPRERCTRSARRRMAQTLRSRLDATHVEQTVRIAGSGLTAVQFVARVDPWSPLRSRSRSTPRVAAEDLQDALTETVRTWEDRILVMPGRDRSIDTLLPGLPPTYKAAVDPAHAAADLQRVSCLVGPDDFGLRTYRGLNGLPRLALYTAGAPPSVGSVRSELRWLGVDVVGARTWEIIRPDGLQCWIHDIGLRHDGPPRAALRRRSVADLESEVCAAFAAAWRGDIDSDQFSALVIRAGLSWREVAVLRAYARCTHRHGGPDAPARQAQVLVSRPSVAAELAALFAVRFDPAIGEEREALTATALGRVQRRLDAVSDPAAERILRGLLTMITATVRTNRYEDRSYLSFTLDPAFLVAAPGPCPRYRVFVDSLWAEGYRGGYEPDPAYAP